MPFNNTYPTADIVKVSDIHGKINALQYDYTVQNLKNTAEEAHSNTEWLSETTVNKTINNQFNDLPSKNSTTITNNDVLILEAADDNYNKYKITYADLIANASGGSGTDSNAIHTNTANEIANITQKSSITDTDIFVIEDSDDSFNKKKVDFNTIKSAIPTTDSNAIHTNTANEIANIVAKTTLDDNDVILIEDSADTYNKKKITFATLSDSLDNGSGSSDIQIPIEDMTPDDVAVGVSEGKAFGAVPTIDFEPDNDGAVWFNCRADRFWNVATSVTLELAYILPFQTSGTTVSLNISAYSLDDGATSLTTLAEQNITIDDSQSGHVQIQNLLNFNITNINSLLVFKVTRNASSTNDTYTYNFKLMKATVKQITT